MILPGIMAGGSGTRLWPISRKFFPKQFLPLTDEASMLQNTCTRLAGLSAQPPMLICGDDHRFIVAEQLREVGEAHSGILLEPAGRNTAPAVALAALHAVAGGKEDPLLLVLAADHSIKDVVAFQAAVTQALPQAEAGKLVTFGIVPSTPETGYGYVKKGSEIQDGVYKVAQFVEKPDKVTAEAYLSSGDYLWNSGMFLFKAKRYLQELQKFNPDILGASRQAIENAKEDKDFLRLDEGSFKVCPSAVSYTHLTLPTIYSV